MSLEVAISVPSAVSSLAFTSSGLLCAGSDDGTLRLYCLPSSKVYKALRSIGTEISSIVCAKSRASDTEDIWLASGRRAFSFQLKSEKLILSLDDASNVLELGEDEEDVLNELDLSDSAKFLAFSTDSGGVGIVELSTQRITRMRTRHSSICGTVKFIPDRPSEVISGGYDSGLLHHDFAQGTLLSRYDITAPPPSSGVSLSPPFVLSTSVCSTGLFAASTADGRVWLGGGGEKRPPPASGAKKKRTRKWEGLREDEGLWLQVAEGPVVAAVFSGTNALITSTLLGRLSIFAVSRDDGKLRTEQTWSAETKGIAKVNAIAIHGHWLCAGGLDKNAKGVIEVWNISETIDGRQV